MNTVVLLGTEHPIQLGKKAPDVFRAVLIEECKKYNVKAIADEINKGDKTIASKIAVDLQLEHLYADPDLKERMDRDIPINIELGIIEEYRNKYPEIAIWREPSKDSLPVEVWEEYVKRTNNAYRMRERVWLEKIKNFNNWPLLFICGADHYNEFSKLLKASGFQVIESYSHWIPV